MCSGRGARRLKPEVPVTLGWLRARRSEGPVHGLRPVAEAVRSLHPACTDSKDLEQRCRRAMAAWGSRRCPIEVRILSQKEATEECYMYMSHDDCVYAYDYVINMCI